MAHHLTEQDETPATTALKEPTRGPLGRTLSTSLLREITGGDKGGPLSDLQIPPPPPPTPG
jgi:hypothetical protein